jgi:hypothetical protein
MPDDPTLPPDDGAEPDPADAELVAYLDGELDATASRRIEARLAADPELRARATSLKRSFDLLDFLPKPEPSPAFATRTLDRLPAVRSSAAAVPVVPSPATASGSVPAPSAVGSGTLVPSAAVPAPTGGFWPWAVGFVLLVAGSLGAGYLGTAAARTYLFPVPPHLPEPTADNLPLADLRIIELLPLYATADDLEFVETLAESERFGEDGPLPASAVEADKADAKDLDSLLRAFRELPADRQEKIRQLDQQLHALPAAQRTRLLRALEGYAAWLHRLPDGERRRVLAAPAAEDRLAAVEDVRRGQWVAGLPAAYRQKLANLVAKDRADLIATWKTEEDTRRENWTSTRFHWDFVRTGRQPWPFADEGMRKQVLDFARSAYHPGDPKRNRLASADITRFNEAVERAEKGGEWVWLGKAVYDFSRTPRYEMYPEAGPGGKMMTDLPELQNHPQLKEAMARRLANKAGAEIVGRWPDFALAVHRDFAKTKIAGKGVDLHLGPARPGEFKEELRQFLPTLQKKATIAEWQGLRDREGKWPDYPAELLRLARAHDLSVPGAMPPGPPSRWEQTYSLSPRPPAKPTP